MAYDNLHAQLHPTHCSPWTIAHLAPLSLGFSRQDYWSGLPCPPPGDLPCPRGRTCISWVSGFFTDWATWEDQWQLTGLWKHLHIPWTTIEITAVHLWELTRIGMVSGISSMIGTWELSLILITLGQLASFSFSFHSFLSPSLPPTLPLSFFLCFFFSLFF